jgi:acetoin utilization deacetylase AcuC-like enzyme
MKIIYSEEHRLRDSKTELFGGELVQPFERPSRMDLILKQIDLRSYGEIVEPVSFGLDEVLRVHDAGYVEFMAGAWEEWVATGYKGEAMPTCWPARRMSDKIPTFVEGKLGYYSLATETSISEGTWEAALVSKDVALTGAKIVGSGQERIAFALCRPPGHHAAIDMYGGYCFINNAAVAAQSLRDQGAKKVAILDVDFHHGNGTQDIFYARDDVFFASLHGDPADAFPHFLGYADETGSGAGEGFTQNYPFAPGTGFEEWRIGLGDAIKRIEAFGPDALVVSLGTDTYKEDPISFFKLDHEDFTVMGQDIAKLNKPTLVVMEGGYAIDDIGINTVNFLSGIEGS